MTPFEVYKTYLAITNHFKGNYDYFKYHGVVSATEASFLKRKDRYFFEKMSRHLGDNDVVGLILSNTVKYKGKYWLSSYPKSTEVYNVWRGKCEGLVYFFSLQMDMIVGHLNVSGNTFGDLFKADGSIPLILRLMLTEGVEPETVIVLDQLAPFLQKISKQLKGDPLWDEEFGFLAKYRPFLKMEDPQKFIAVIKEKIKDVEKGL